MSTRDDAGSSFDRRGQGSVSVVVATRDRPVLLRKAISSILDQSYEGDVECLVVFDQSTVDQSLETSKPGRRVRCLRNERTSGLAGARNTGALASTGQFLAFCDDDDEWRPDKLSFQLAALRAAPGAGVIVSGVEIEYQGRTTIRVPPTERIEHSQLLRSRMMEAHPSTVVVSRAHFLGLIGLVDEDIPGSFAEDYEWMLRASAVTQVVAVQEPLVKVLWHRSSWFAHRWQTIIDALNYLIDKHPDFKGEPRGLARIYGQIAFAQAALEKRSDARSWARRSLALDARQGRAYLALLVSSGLVKADTIMRIANSRGKGI